MTQIVVTLDSNADENLLRRMIENMKGVLKTTLTHNREDIKVKDSKTETSQWIETLHSIKYSINSNVIDISDPRTNYIMSK